MSHLSQPVMIQGDREIFPEDIDHIRTILERFSSLSRYEIILTLCETLEWLTPAGRPKIDACTKLLKRLQDDGMIRLPALQEIYSHPGRKLQSTPVTMSARSAPQPDLETSLAALGPVTLTSLDDKTDQSLWNEYVQRYHYLGYKKPFGYRQRYFIGKRPAIYICFSHLRSAMMAPAFINPARGKPHDTVAEERRA